jgi:hypothetical protein
VFDGDPLVFIGGFSIDYTFIVGFLVSYAFIGGGFEGGVSPLKNLISYFYVLKVEK